MASWLKGTGGAADVEVLSGAVLDGTESRIARMRWHAELAEAYAQAIRHDPRLAAGFGKLRAKHLAHVAALAIELIADARLRGAASVGR